MTLMPQSPVLDASGGMRAEWRNYLEVANARVAFLDRTKITGTGAEAIVALKERIGALRNRVERLPALANNKSSRIVKKRLLVETGSGPVVFNHGLGTQHVFWQIRRISDGLIVGAGPETQIQGFDAASVRMNNVGAGAFDAMFYGVISDYF